MFARGKLSIRSPIGPSGTVGQVSQCPNQAGRDGTVGQGLGQGLRLSPSSQPSGPKWHCWSGLLCPQSFPNQAGLCGAVGQDFVVVLPSIAKFLLVILPKSFDSVVPNHSGRVALLVRISLLLFLLGWNLPGAFTSFF